MEKPKIYKDEESKIICEYIQKLREEINEKQQFLIALEKKMIKSYQLEKEIKEMEGR